ncbi:MAG TPA: 16S rRNA (adenine(1518)-N(6)/adenine(1519)-N(6))-dimethyltransferase RsmA [Candidatus Bathyarchaeia archaeon]|nr:16S rRNA (adenine(1518)-N(6)/adenine(1519)-N(6))-dimethyltransferase RsmA [Candidatus Bathyarchaeia archaeon]
MSELIIKTRDALLEAGTYPKKGLSQNFIINEEILNKQIEYAQVSDNDIVLEIGGGTGLLTEKLASVAKRVFCIEYDSNLAKYLINKFKSKNNVTIIEGDALKIDFPEANKIVANLPYHISTPLTFKILDMNFDIAILMYQYEFARRMVAEPNSEDYSRLTANLQYQANVDILQRVSRGFFYPMPKVDSAIVKITLKKIDLPVPVEEYRIVSRILFNTKNKIVSSVLYDYFKRRIPKDDRIDFRNLIAEKIELSNLRVRELSVDKLVCITKDLSALLSEVNLSELLFKDEKQ